MVEMRLEDVIVRVASEDETKLTSELRIVLLREKSGDRVVFYTDGVTEPENAYGEMFGEERLTELLVRNAQLDEAHIVTAITDAVREWTGSDELQDDMTLLLMRQL